jgi:hypothetical protein
LPSDQIESCTDTKEEEEEEQVYNLPRKDSIYDSDYLSSYHDSPVSLDIDALLNFNDTAIHHTGSTSSTSNTTYNTNTNTTYTSTTTDLNYHHPESALPPSSPNPLTNDDLVRAETVKLLGSGMKVLHELVKEETKQQQQQLNSSNDRSSRRKNKANTTNNKGGKPKKTESKKHAVGNITV